MNWSEPDVPAAYSGVSFLTDDLAVPFFAEEACGMGAHFTAREATIFSRKMFMLPANLERWTGQAATTCGEGVVPAGGPFSRYVVETTTACPQASA